MEESEFSFLLERACPATRSIFKAGGHRGPVTPISPPLFAPLPPLSDPNSTIHTSIHTSIHTPVHRYAKELFSSNRPAASPPRVLPFQSQPPLSPPPTALIPSIPPLKTHSME
jgi:hypothetical protein